MSLDTANALGLSICEVVKIVYALFILKTTEIDVVDLLDCERSCDWVIFTKFNQWNALLLFTGIPNTAG